MCLLALYFQAFSRYPIVVAANRDEHHDRPSAAPQILRDKPLVYGGKDLRAGGTWLGVNEHGLFVGVLNRRAEPLESAPLRSRGLLCLDLLAAKDAAHARQALGDHEAFSYRPFNLVFGDPRAAFAAYNEGGRIFCFPLAAGVHVFGNAPLRETTSEKLKWARRLFERARPQASDAPAVEELRAALSDHTGARDNGPKDAICVHLPAYGTVSSSLLFYDRARRLFLTYYAPGPPCQRPYEKGLLIPLP
ncbi:MAG TPA: NRDE family protein [Candidatus Acidoferrales bacterium]|nr:NRDE family protein [Candidatus Acidoferrales bacterium]